MPEHRLANYTARGVPQEDIDVARVPQAAQQETCTEGAQGAGQRRADRV